MLVKLLNSTLIRTLGGSIVNMTEPQALKYIKKGLAVEYIKPENKRKYSEETKAINVPPENKMIWSPPEQKTFDDEIIMNSININPYPGPNDILFSQIN